MYSVNVGFRVGWKAREAGNGQREPSKVAAKIRPRVIQIAHPPPTPNPQNKPPNFATATLTATIFTESHRL